MFRKPSTKAKLGQHSRGRRARTEDPWLGVGGQIACRSPAVQQYSTIDPNSQGEAAHAGALKARSEA